MNKLLLASLSCILLLVNGDFEFRKDDSRSHTQFPASSVEERRTMEHEREKRVPVGKELDSFGYAWNIGSGVSYMKMHVGKDQFGGSIDRLRSAQHQVEQSFQESDHKAGQRKVETDKFRVGTSENVQNGNYKSVKNSFEVMDLLKPNRQNVNEETRIKTSENGNDGIVTTKFGSEGTNFGEHSFITDKKKGDEKLIRVQVDSDEDFSKDRLDGNKDNDDRISHETIGSLTNSNFDFKEASFIPHRFYLSNDKSNAKVLAGVASGKGYIGLNGREKLGNVQYETRGFGSQISDSKVEQSFDSNYKSIDGEDIGGLYKFGEEQAYDVGRNHRGNLYNSKPWISEHDNHGFGFKGLNVGEDGFVLTNKNAGNSAHESITRQLNYGPERYHGTGYVAGPKLKLTDLNHGKQIAEEEKIVDDAHFPAVLLNGYSLGLAQRASNLGGDNQDKLNFGDTTWNLVSIPRNIQSQINSAYREGRTGKNMSYANENNIGGENREDGTTVTKHSENNIHEELTKIPIDIEKHESQFHGNNDSKDKQNFLMKLGNDHIVGVHKQMNSRLPYNVLSLGNDRPFTKKLIAEQAEKLVQDNNYRSAVDGSFLGANIYNVLDGNKQSDISGPEYKLQVPSVDSQRNINYYNGEVDSNNGFTIGGIGLINDSMKHDARTDNNFNDESWIKESKIEGAQEGASKTNIENGIATSVSYSNIRLGHSLSKPSGLEPFLNSHEFNSMFLKNHTLGERSLPSENIITQSSESKDDDDKVKAIWRKQRFSGKYLSERRPTLVNAVDGVKSTKNLEEITMKAKKQDFQRHRDERKGKELKKSVDLKHQIKEKIANKEVIDHESVDHLSSSTIAKHSIASDNGDEHSHWEDNVEEEYEGGEIKHQESGNLGHFPFFFHKEPEVREITKAIPVHKELKIPVPQLVHHPILIPVPVKVLEPYPIKIPVPVAVEKTVEVPVEKLIPYPVEKPVPVKVIKKIRVPVPKPYPVKVPVYKVKYIHHNKKKHH